MRFVGSLLCFAAIAGCGNFLGLSGNDDTTAPTFVDDAGPEASTSSGESDGATSGNDGGAGGGDATSDGGDPSPCVASSCPKHVFVTQAVFNGNLGGVEGADLKCQEAGEKYLQGRSWKAWISTSKTSVNARFTTHPNDYVTGKNVTVAAGWLAFASTKHGARIMAESTLPPLSEEDVWTGTLPTGDAAGDGFDCDGWTSALNTHDGIVGRASATDATWSNGGTLQCANEAHLYCVEQ